MAKNAVAPVEPVAYTSLPGREFVATPSLQGNSQRERGEKTNGLWLHKHGAIGHWAIPEADTQKFMGPTSGTEFGPYLMRFPSPYRSDKAPARVDVYVLVRRITALATDSWKISVQIDGVAVVGSPFEVNGGVVTGIADSVPKVWKVGTFTIDDGVTDHVIEIDKTEPVGVGLLDEDEDTIFGVLVTPERDVSTLNNGNLVDTGELFAHDTLDTIAERGMATFQLRQMADMLLDVFKKRVDTHMCSELGWVLSIANAGAGVQETIYIDSITVQARVPSVRVCILMSWGPGGGAGLSKLFYQTALENQAPVEIPVSESGTEWYCFDVTWPETRTDVLTLRVEGGVNIFALAIYSNDAEYP